jgi:hypothetical protein
MYLFEDLVDFSQQIKEKIWCIAGWTSEGEGEGSSP